MGYCFWMVVVLLVRGVCKVISVGPGGGQKGLGAYERRAGHQRWRVGASGSPAVHSKANTVVGLGSGLRRDAQGPARCVVGLFVEVLGFILFCPCHHPSRHPSSRVLDKAGRDSRQWPPGTRNSTCPVQRCHVTVDYRCTTVPKVWTGIPCVNSHLWDGL